MQCHSERNPVSGAIRVWAFVNDGSGLYIKSKLYFGFTKKEAIAQFKAEFGKE